METLIKCIVIASGNDASVAMAEHIAGSETAFVERMNQRAAELSLEHTHFVDCCGLTDDAAHYMSAGDIAVVSRELVLSFPGAFWIFNCMDGGYYPSYPSGGQHLYIDEY